MHMHMHMHLHMHMHMHMHLAQSQVTCHSQPQVNPHILCFITNST